MDLDALSADKLQTTARQHASWVVGALKQFAEDRCAAMAASIAFYAAFSLSPMLVMVIAVAGWFFGAEAARGELFNQVHGMLGNEAASSVQTIVENAHRSGNAGGIAALISLLMLAVGASATFSSLNSALNIVWPTMLSRTSSVLALVRVRLISFGLVLGVAFLLIVSLVLDTVLTFLGQWLWGNSPYMVLSNLLQLFVGGLVLALAFAALLKFLPDARVRWRDALVGGIIAALLFSLGKKLFALYLAHAGMASTFGAAGSLAVLLMWLYFSAAVLLLGAEFSAARGRLNDPRGVWGLMDNDPPPGSRAALASALAASTRVSAAPVMSQATTTLTTLTTDTALACADGTLATQAARTATAEASATRPISQRLAEANTQAIHTMATMIEQASHLTTEANRHLKRQPWGPLTLAAGLAFAFASRASRRGNRARSRPTQ
ncbi:YihY/virulence factor BrkB family protein [Paraburkholderia hayleyella]|uniref:YihY/virulence factor BrkB family protein n=1 Tax=Paraburkholderia hayleyella TaxID=2152889 RepID=UPI001291BE43|nr:YihY/virulence factor BrkB family protein [Paraburkholderia hayleyella]